MDFSSRDTFWDANVSIKARYWEQQGKFKYIHITMVLLYRSVVAVYTNDHHYHKRLQSSGLPASTL